MEAVNPYQAPEGELVKDTDAVGEVKFFAFSGRIGRLRYLAHTFVASIPLYLLIGVFSGLSAAMENDVAQLAFGAGIIFTLIALVVCVFIITAQRLHDMDLSAAYMLIFLIPIINSFMGLYLALAPGKDGVNNYGAPPPANKTWHWVCGMALPVIALIGILAAVALPAYQGYVERAQQVQVQE